MLINLVRLLIFLAVVFLVVGVWNMTQMAPHIGSWAKRGSYGRYAFFLDSTDFKNPDDGLKYRNRHYTSLALFLLTLLMLAVVIIMMPNGTQL
jgi:hypothetical protein